MHAWRTFTHLEKVSGLETTLTTHGPELALVTGADFQVQETRLQIQHIVGTRPCMVRYIADAKRQITHQSPLGIKNFESQRLNMLMKPLFCESLMALLRYNGH